MVVDLGASHPWPVHPGRSGARPLYERVEDYIGSLVAEQGLVPGDLLPTYAELAASTGVSLITVRRALEELEKAGRVRRHQGVGTFLARPRFVTEPALAGRLLRTLRSADAGPPAGAIETRVVEICRGLPSAGLAGALQIEPSLAVWRLQRQRLVDGQPAVAETSIIPVALAPTLDRRVRAMRGPLYGLLAGEYGLEDDYEEQYLEVIVRPGQAERDLLEIPARTPVVRIRGLSVDKSGTPFDCFEQLYRATEFAVAISGRTSRQMFPTTGRQDWDMRVWPADPSGAGSPPAP
jgi:DNA-binding GntR family transcriptional regulator